MGATGREPTRRMRCIADGLEGVLLQLSWMPAYRLTLGSIELVALVLGVVWAAVNFYHFYPVFQTLAERLFGRFPGESGNGSLAEDELPAMDIVLPAYQEGDVIEQSIASVRNAEYPQDRLRVLVVVEAGDADTRSALRDLTDYEFTELPVPASYPGEPNKPRALNYAFESTGADVVGVIDAEDVVDPTLFREAATRLAGECEFVQARLDMVNENDGWLNVAFRAEYGYWYHVIMPAFYRIGYPMPLAGTSCLFRRSVLVAADVDRRDRYREGLARDGRLWTGSYRLAGWSPWDSTNVTEDFELGLFLWERGFRIGYLEATTAEESPVSFDAWIKQRTRWKKGKLQTLRKHLSAPPEGLVPKLHLFGQSALPHVGPINLVGLLVVGLLANLATYEPSLIVTAVLSLGLAFALIGLTLTSVGYWMASDAPTVVRLRRATMVGVTFPFYWLLQWAADVRAVWQTYTGRFDWERVDHFGRNAIDIERSTATDTAPNELEPARRYALLTAIVVAAAALRFFDLDRISLWSDEIYSITVRGARPIPELLVVPLDPHPPLYFVLLHVWTDVFGTTAASSRSLSVVFSVATVVGVYLLGTELFTDRVGLMAAGFVAVSSFHVHHARIARMYSLFGLLTVLSWLGFVRLRRHSRWNEGGYVVATVALFYVHAFALFVLAAQYLFVLLSETRAGVSAYRWIRLQAVVGVLVAPVLAFLSWRSLGSIIDSAAGAAITWIPPPSTAAMTTTLLEFVGYPAHYPVAGGSPGLWLFSAALLLIVCGVVLLAFVTYRPDDGYLLPADWRTSQVASLAILPLVLPFVLSYFLTPLFAPRFTLPASLGLALLVAVGITNVPGRRLRWGIVAVLLVGMASLTGAYFAADTVEDWRGATDALEAGVDGDDLVVVQPGWIQSNLRYYSRAPTGEWAPVSAGPLSRPTRETLRERFARHERIWVVTYRGAPSDDVRGLLAGRQRTETFDDGVITVARYDRTADDSDT